MTGAKKILVVAAHPDDEVLGCGGTIARLTKKGAEVNIAILGEGVTSRYKDREEADFEEMEELYDSSREAAKILGAKSVTLLKLPDNRFDSLPLLDVVKVVEDLIHKFKPDTIFTHGSGDLNIDHRVTFEAVLTASRPVNEHKVSALYCFKALSSTEWSFDQLGDGFRPNVFVDIKETLELKKKALQAYKNEIRSFPHPRSLEILRADTEKSGSCAGLEACEEFQLIREIIS